MCGDGIDNDCDGQVDEGCNLVPTIFASASPLSGVFPLDVSFVCQGVGGDGDLVYSWDFGDGDSSALQNPMHVYSSAGDYNAVCRVEDVDGDWATGSVSIKVGMQDLKVVGLECFEDVIVGHNQSCSISVENSLGDKVGGVEVEVYYGDGSSFGSCVSDPISGACGVKDLQNVVGDFEVYAEGSKSGYLSDISGSLRFGYEVWKEEYDIVDLKVWNDSGFSSEDYDFFRGEDLYSSFRVLDSLGNEVSSDLITNVSLVSSVAGGRVSLDRVSKVGANYYYGLIPVPVTHDFIGDSNVFAFVFDVANGSGGQEEVSLIIRNNVPAASAISNRSIEEGDDFSLNLSDYESDVEDSGDDLSWSIVGLGTDLVASVVGKVLIVEGVDEGESEVVLRLTDLDGDFDEVSFWVEVSEEEDNSRSRKRCVVDWVCFDWNGCSDGSQTRICMDDNGCGSYLDKPLEVRSCSSDLEVVDGVISLGGFSAEEKVEMDGFVLWIVFGILVLILLIGLVLVLRR
ncbi:PKD domain-containing protein [Methanococcoides sp. SA1]|nr:PKD domain-containing protein [Methanococcoides sp. SA1]